MAPFLFYMIVLILIVVIVLSFVVLNFSLSAPKYKGPITDHFDGKVFFTPGAASQHGLPQLFKWMINRKRGPWKETTTRTYGNRPLEFEKDGIRITFVNHSTFLIQVGGLNILTDPVWSTRVSPFSWIGPKRMRPPGIRLGDLPRIHVIALTHNHYDHLDIATLRTLFGAHHPKIVTPLGVKAYLDSHRLTGATDLDWWQQLQLNDKVAIEAVPARHFSGRGSFDRNATLWCGYVFKTNQGNIYFAGDSGYEASIFKQIGERFKTMRVSLIPIGAYKPNWFMSPVHVSPEEAVQIHIDVHSQLSIGMHFGTFPLADEGQEDPVQDLRSALSTRGISPEEFIVLDEGVGKLI